MINWLLLGPGHDAVGGRLVVPFVALAAVCALTAAWQLRAGAHASSEAASPTLGLTNPFSLTEAAKFALFFALVLVVLKVVQGRYPEQGPLVVAGLAGLTDVDAITLSMARFAREGGAGSTATAAIVIASLTNTLVKSALAVALGSAALRRRVLAGTGVILAAGAGALLLG